MRRAGRAAAAAVLIAVVALTFAAPARAQVNDEQPTASIKKKTWQPGEKMFVEGKSWSKGNVAVQICGNNEVNGTPDCDMLSARNFGVAADTGTFRGNIFVAIPPVPCPCVVVVRSTTSSAQGGLPISLSGADVNEGPPPVRHDPAQTTVS